MAVNVEHLLAARAQKENPAALPQGWLNRYGLRFRADLEETFLTERTERNVPVVYVTALIAYVLLGIFLLNDALTLQRFMGGPMMIVLSLCGLSGLLGVLRITRRAQDGYPQSLALLVVGSNGLGLLTACIYGTAMGKAWPYEILYINLLYLFFFAGLTLRNTLAPAVLIVVVYGVGQAWAGLAQPFLFNQTLFLAGAVVLCITAGYLMERSERESWLRAQHISDLSQRDALTGLLNHRVFFERAEAAIRMARREKQTVAVLLGDADYFKKFNDSHGHLAGDRCLRRIAETMDKLARRPLDLVARLGGEEFAILFYGANRSWVVGHADELRAEIAWLELGEQAGTPLRATMSFGVALLEPGDPRSLEDLLKQADGALYQAKDQGRDRVVVA